MRLTHEADRIAKDVVAYVRRGEPVPTWRQLRDDCDLSTYSDLAPSILDRLTDMVERRVKREVYDSPGFHG
jgi:hypothetical protein